MRSGRRPGLLNESALLSLWRWCVTEAFFTQQILPNRRIRQNHPPHYIRCNSPSSETTVPEIRMAVPLMRISPARAERKSAVLSGRSLD